MTSFIHFMIDSFLLYSRYCTFGGRKITIQYFALIFFLSMVIIYQQFSPFTNNGIYAILNLLRIESYLAQRTTIKGQFNASPFCGLFKIVIIKHKQIVKLRNLSDDPLSDHTNSPSRILETTSHATTLSHWF
jgi:hypothetical protein